jgi:hypothetical protein
MADFGLQGFMPKPDGVDWFTHVRTILDALPEVFSTVWISDHLQHQDEP